MNPCPAMELCQSLSIGPCSWLLSCSWLTLRPLRCLARQASPTFLGKRSFSFLACGACRFCSFCRYRMNLMSSILISEPNTHSNCSNEYSTRDLLQYTRSFMLVSNSNGRYKKDRPIYPTGLATYKPSLRPHHRNAAVWLARPMSALLPNK